MRYKGFRPVACNFRGRPVFGFYYWDPVLRVLVRRVQARHLYQAQGRIGIDDEIYAGFVLTNRALTLRFEFEDRNGEVVREIEVPAYWFRARAELVRIPGFEPQYMVGLSELEQEGQVEDRFPRTLELF